MTSSWIDSHLESCKIMQALVAPSSEGGRLVFWFSKNICQIVRIYFCLTRHGDRIAPFAASQFQNKICQKNLHNYPVFIGTFYLKFSFSEMATNSSWFGVWISTKSKPWGRLNRFLWPSQKSGTLVVRGGKTSASFFFQKKENVGFKVSRAGSDTFADPFIQKVLQY